MGKKIDDNGFWLIENNPLSKAGIFQYYGAEIDRSLTPDKLYNVYRPAEELNNPETIKSFELVPLINDHEFLGADYTPPENKGIDGVISQPYFENDRLKGHLKIYSESMKNAITGGKKELSPGYTCEYEITSGVFNGERYDAIQRNIRGNHVALVDEGRTGHDNRVYDKKIIREKQGFALDSKNLKQVKPQEEKENNTMKNKKKTHDKAALKAKIQKAVKDGVSEVLSSQITGEAAKEEILEKIVEVVEEVAEAVIEEETAEVAGETDPKTEGEVLDKDETKDPDPAKDEDPDDKKEAEPPAKETAPVVNEDAIARKVLQSMTAKDEIVKTLVPLIGTFDHSAMTADDVASYGAKKLSLDASSPVVAKAGIMAFAKAQKPEKLFSLDQAIKQKNDNGDDGDFAVFAKGDK